MSDISVDKKLQLVQQVRSQYNRNQYDLRSREQILYGRSSTVRATAHDELPVYGNDTGSEDGLPKSTFKLRFLAALILVVAVMVFDNNGHTLLGIDTRQIFAAISENFDVESLQLPDNMVFMQEGQK